MLKSAIAEQPIAWAVMEEKCDESRFCFAATGFNGEVKLTKHELLVFAYPDNRLQDPMFGIVVSWKDLYLDAPTIVKGTNPFTFDASGIHANVLVAGMNVAYKIEDDGLRVDVTHANHDGILLSESMLWDEIEDAGEDFSLINDLQSLYSDVSDRVRSVFRGSGTR